MAPFLFIENNGTLRSGRKKLIQALGIGCGWCLLVEAKLFTLFVVLLTKFKHLAYNVYFYRTCGFTATSAGKL